MELLLQSLAGEKWLLQSTSAQLERELMARKGQLAGQAKSCLSLTRTRSMLCALIGLQSLAGEKRRLHSASAQLESYLVAREGQLAGQAGELAALQEAQRDAYAQMDQYVMDLQVCRPPAQ